MRYASLHSCLRMIAAPREAPDNFSGGNPIGVAHARASFQALSLTRRRQVGLHPHGPRDRPEPCRATQGPGGSGSRDDPSWGRQILQRQGARRSPTAGANVSEEDVRSFMDDFLFRSICLNIRHPSSQFRGMYICGRAPLTKTASFRDIGPPYPLPGNVRETCAL